MVRGGTSKSVRVGFTRREYGRETGRVSIREISALGCSREFFGFHFRKDIFGGCIWRGIFLLNGICDIVKELFNFELDKRVWKRYADKVSTRYRLEDFFDAVHRLVSRYWESG